METWMAEHIFWVRIIISALMGGLAAGMGWVLGTYILARAGLSKKTATSIAVVLCVVLSLPVSAWLTRHWTQPSIADQAMVEIKKNPFYATVMKYHSDAEEQIKSHIQAAVDQQLPALETAMVLQSNLRPLADKYYLQHLPTASYQTVHAYLRHNYDTHVRFKDKPDVCVAYFMGNPINPADIPMEVIDIESRLKAAIIESSVSHPEPVQKASLDGLAESYNKGGENPEDLDKMGMIQALPAEEGCRLATVFSKILANNSEYNVNLFKTLMTTEETPSRE